MWERNNREREKIKGVIKEKEEAEKKKMKMAWR